MRAASAEASSAHSLGGAPPKLCALLASADAALTSLDLSSVSWLGLEPWSLAVVLLKDQRSRLRGKNHLRDYGCAAVVEALARGDGARGEGARGSARAAGGGGGGPRRPLVELNLGGNRAAGKTAEALASLLRLDECSLRVLRTSPWRHVAGEPAHGPDARPCLPRQPVGPRPKQLQRAHVARRRAHVAREQVT